MSRTKIPNHLIHHPADAERYEQILGMLVSLLLDRTSALVRPRLIDELATVGAHSLMEESRLALRSLLRDPSLVEELDVAELEHSLAATLGEALPPSDAEVEGHARALLHSMLRAWVSGLYRILRDRPSVRLNESLMPTDEAGRRLHQRMLSATAQFAIDGAGISSVMMALKERVMRGGESVELPLGLWLRPAGQDVEALIMSTNTTATRALRLPVAATETTCGQCGYLGRGTEAASCALFRKIVGDAHGDPQRLAECRAAETVESAESADLAYWRKEAGRLQTIVGAVCELARSGQESAIDAVRRVVLDNVNLRNELSELRAVRERAVYFVDCSTGCSCCQGEDHERGPFSSRAIAEARAKQYRAAPLLTSQYAPRGMYLVCERKAEVLPDERLVVDGRVYDKLVDCVPAGDDAEKCPA